MKKVVLLFSLLCSLNLAFGQDKGTSNSLKFEIKGQIKGLGKSELYFSHYFGSTQQVIKDTAQVDDNGNFTISGTEELPKGLYFVNFSKNKLIDFVIGDPFFSFSTDTLDLIGNMKIVNSKENDAFFGFQKKMNELFAPLQKDRTLANNKQALDKIRAQVKEYQTNWLASNRDLFVSKIIGSSLDVDVPSNKKILLTKKDTLDNNRFQFAYYKSHYFDRIDLNDERMLRTPFLQKKLDKYFEDLVVQQADSIANDADRLLAKISQPDIRKYVIYKISNTYENSKIVGTEGAFVHMAEKYYINEPALWDTSTVRQLRDRIKIIKPLLIGKKFPEMYLTNQEGKLVTVNNLPGKYTLVFLYDPECSHCRQETPKLVAQKDYLKSKGVSVIAASIVREKDKWKKFIAEFKTNDFYNGIDIHKNQVTGKEEYYTDFLKTFDVYSTPVIYLLDAKKNIIVKRIGVEDIKPFLEYYEKRK